MRKLAAVDKALDAWVAAISDPAYDAPSVITEFVKAEANGRLRDLLLAALEVPKTQQTWPARK